MRIDRCNCFSKTFTELKRVADRMHIYDLEVLQTVVTFGERCRLCHPYVRRMLRTGETVFYEIITETEEPG